LKLRLFLWAVFWFLLEFGLEVSTLLDEWVFQATCALLGAAFYAQADT
jgi:hypothetical protein